jgi:hypothetical protein
MIIPSRCAPFVYGVIQAAITTGVASAVATLRVAPLSSAWIADWLVAWAIAWAATLPLVVFAAPLMQRLVQAITSPHRTSCGGWRLASRLTSPTSRPAHVVALPRTLSSAICVL